MKSIIGCFLLLCLIRFVTLGNEENVKAIIESSEMASARAELDARALINSLASEAKQFKMSLKDAPIQRSDKNCLSKQAHTPTPGKCGMSLKVPSLQNPRSNKASAQMIIFVSSSMSQQSIKALGEEVSKIGGKIVFRGLIGGTFKETQSYMQALGIVADIDPTKFEDHQIVQVPTFLLVQSEVVDRVAGNISIWEALEQFERKGDLKVEAKRLYEQLKQSVGQGLNS